MTEDELAIKAATFKSKDFAAKSVKIATTDAEGKIENYDNMSINYHSIVISNKISAQQEREASGSFDEDDLENIFKKLPNDKDTVAKLCSAIVPADFEKDDDSNRHIDFIVACSNSRAANYGIEPADRSKSKVILIKVIVRKGAYKIDIRSALRGASFLPLLRLRRWSPVLFRLNFTKLSMESTTLKSIKILSSTWRCRLSHFLSLWHQQRYLKRIEEFENFK